MRILFAEDSVLAYAAARVLSGRNGHQVDVVDTAEAAVDAILNGGYDIVVTDWRLPGGGEVVVDQARLASVPVGVFSGLEGEEIGHGLPHLQKPASLSALADFAEGLLPAAVA